MNPAGKKAKAIRWILFCAVFAVFFYALFYHIIFQVTAYPNATNLVKSYGKLKSSLKEHSYVFPDLSELDASSEEYSVYMDGDTLLAKPQGYGIVTEQPSEPCVIRYSISACTDGEMEDLLSSSREGEGFTQAEYKNVPITTQYARNDSVNVLRSYFSVGGNHYCVSGFYYTEKYLDSREKEGRLTQSEQELADTIIYEGVEKLTRQMIADAV